MSQNRLKKEIRKFRCISTLMLCDESVVTGFHLFGGKFLQSLYLLRKRLDIRPHKDIKIAFVIILAGNGCSNLSC